MPVEEQGPYHAEYVAGPLVARVREEHQSVVVHMRCERCGAEGILTRIRGNAERAARAWLAKIA